MSFHAPRFTENDANRHLLIMLAAGTLMFVFREGVAPQMIMLAASLMFECLRDEPEYPSNAPSNAERSGE